MNNYCDICWIMLPSESTRIAHLNSKNHFTNKSFKENLKSSKYDHYCDICCVIGQSEDLLKRHLESKKHLEKKSVREYIIDHFSLKIQQQESNNSHELSSSSSKHQTDNKSTKLNQINNCIITKFNEATETEMEDISKKVDLSSNKGLLNDNCLDATSLSLCCGGDTCDGIMKSNNQDNSKTKRHLIKYENESNSSSSSDSSITNCSIKKSITLNDISTNCLRSSSKIQIIESNANIHNNNGELTTENNEVIKNSKNIDSLVDKAVCRLCDVVFTSDANRAQHLQGTRHIKNVKKYYLSQTSIMPEINSSSHIIKRSQTVFVSLNSVQDDDMNETNKNENKVPQKNSTTSVSYFCKLCGVHANSEITFERHIKSERHKKLTSKNANKLETSIDESSSESANQSVIVDNKLTPQLIVSDINNNNENEYEIPLHKSNTFCGAFESPERMDIDSLSTMTTQLSHSISNNTTTSSNGSIINSMNDLNFIDRLQKKTTNTNKKTEPKIQKDFKIEESNHDFEASAYYIVPNNDLISTFEDIVKKFDDWKTDIATKNAKIQVATI